MTHCRPETLACSSRWIDGSATFTTVTSSPTMNRLMQQIASTSIRRDLLSSPIRITSVCLAGGDVSPPQADQARTAKDSGDKAEHDERCRMRGASRQLRQVAERRDV